MGRYLSLPMDFLQGLDSNVDFLMPLRLHIHCQVYWLCGPTQVNLLVRAIIALLPSPPWLDRGRKRTLKGRCEVFEGLLEAHLCRGVGTVWGQGRRLSWRGGSLVVVAVGVFLLHCSRVIPWSYRHYEEGQCEEKGLDLKGISSSYTLPLRARPVSSQIPLALFIMLVAHLLQGMETSGNQGHAEKSDI